MPPFPYKRIVVIGATSSGKSTLAEELAKRLDLDFIELDALHWEPNWKEASFEDFRARVGDATRTERWVVAGNYHVVRDLVWSQAEAVVWLDYSLWLISGGCGIVPGPAGGTRRNYGMATANEFGGTSNSGRTIRSSSGFSKRTGEERVNTRSCWRCLDISI